MALFRIEPLRDAGHYKTFTMRKPFSTHWRQASCEEVGCVNYLNGWQTIVPAGSDHADLIRSLRYRYHYTERAADGGLVEFTFPAGQQCFSASAHRQPVQREPLFLITGGDYRGNPAGVPATELRVEQWIDDFATHQDKIADAVRKG
jgi:hypothetical protein